MEDGALQPNPGRGEPEGERPVPVGVDVVEWGAAVASTIGEGTGRCCPGQVEVDPPQACCDDEAEDGDGDRDRLPVGLVDTDGDRGDGLAE